MTARDVISAFHTAGLEADRVRPMNANDYGMAPMVCEGTRFFTPSLGSGFGGRIFVCGGDRDRAALHRYYTSLGEATAALHSWVFEQDNILVQINGSMEEEDARAYEKALRGMK